MTGKALDKKTILLAVLAVLVFLVVKLFAQALGPRVSISWPRSGVHAVFLSNGQVYFGKIEKESRDVLVLGDIFYLKLSKPVLSQEELQNESATSLIKLGNELHGPEDRMAIRQSQILFVEKLKPDSRVVKAIEEYRKGK